MTDRLKAIDLFCGCGGISCGLSELGIEVLAGLDIEKKYITSFTKNFPNALSIEEDITQYSPETLMKLLKIKSRELDFIVGGPPCQGFSKNVPRKSRYLDDPRNQLISSFLYYCEIIQPKFIIMENVAEMKNGFDQTYSQEIIERLEKQGYFVTSIILNAADYGVPQRRKRAFFIANRVGFNFSVPDITHVAFSKNSKTPRVQFSLFEKPSHISVWEAIGDLPSLKHGEGADIQEYSSPPQNEYQKIMRSKSKFVSNHRARYLQDIQYQRLASLEPGQGHDDLPEYLQVASGYSGAYGRLTKEMVSPTITRWVFHTGSGRWGHPIDLRILTIREVARIQSFPDHYIFLGSYNDQAGQLGNAVPPALIKIIVSSMISQANLFLERKNSSNSLKSTESPVRLIVEV